MYTDWFPKPQISSFLSWPNSILWFRFHPNLLWKELYPILYCPWPRDAPNIQTEQKMLPECRSTMSLCHLDVIGHFSDSFSLAQNFRIYVLSLKKFILLTWTFSSLFPFRYVRSLFFSILVPLSDFRFILRPCPQKTNFEVSLYT